MADGVKVVSRNRKAHHDYEILDAIEAGVVLMGSEIKSIRAGKANITEGFVQIRGRELWLLNVHIAVYDEAGVFGHEALRPRKLLLHKKEIVRLQTRVREKGLTIVPLQLYMKNRRVKVEIGIGRGKKNYDKRESLRQKDASRQVSRALKEHVR